MKGSGTEGKQLAAAMALLIVLLGCSLGNAWYAQRLTEAIAKPLEQAQHLARADRWEEAAKLTQGSYDNWNGHHFYLQSGACSDFSHSADPATRYLSPHGLFGVLFRERFQQVAAFMSIVRIDHADGIVTDVYRINLFGSARQQNIRKAPR